MNQFWDWGYVGDILPQMARGALVTFELTALGSAIAFSLGLLLAILRRSSLSVISQPVRGLIEFVRSTPLLVQAYLLFYVLPAYGIRLPAFLTGVIVLGLHYSTYAAEVYRAGIEGVPSGQWEAARALSLPRGRTWTSVILPQAIPRVLPALGNYVISMFKEVPILAAIGVVALFGTAIELGNEQYRYVEPYTLAGLFFLALSYPSSLLVRRLERRLGH